ncbi:TPM domain-containing protein [Pseudomonas sp. NPDC089734]|uniref:TPM domain-containing protein n=1 Tax=Pseudomonas sp. NPDC089734 TaxID=3364469 RepID=UPI00382345E3
MVISAGGVLRVQAEPPALVFPPMTGSVVDSAQMLDSQATVRLTKMLQNHEQATGERIVVVTVADLQGATIEDYGARLGSAWGLGSEGKSTSVLMVVGREKRKILIEAGSALQERLTDAQASLIINMLIAPEFNRGRFSAGIERGAQAVVIALGGHVPEEPELSAELSTYDTQVGNDVAWQIAGGLVVVVLLIVFVCLRGTAVVRRTDACRGTAGSGGKFGGGASGNW